MKSRLLNYLTDVESKVASDIPIAPYILTFKRQDEYFLTGIKEINYKYIVSREVNNEKKAYRVD